MKLIIAVVIISILGVIACNNDDSMSPSYAFLQTPSAESVDFVPGYASTANQVFYSSMPDSLRDYYIPFNNQAGQVKGEFNEFIIHGDTAWSYVDDEVRTELENWRDHPFYYSIANYVSNRMLWYQLLGDSTYTTSKKEAIQFYVNLALEYNNPDAEMQAEAFKILHDNSFWSTSRINTAADSATDHATEYLQLADWNICNCEDSTGTAGYIQDALDAKSAKLDLIDDYLGVLDSLSNL